MGIRTALLRTPSRAALCRGAATLIAIASLVACSGHAPSVSLPSKQSSAPAAESPSDGAAASPRQAAIDAYLSFWPTSSQAEETGNAVAARTILTAYVDPNFIGYMLSGMQAAWAKREVNWGASVEHIQSVTMATIGSGEQTALVKDCQDDSHDGLASAQTGDLVPGTLGSAHQELYASLSLINGHWFVEQVTFVGATCKE